MRSLYNTGEPVMIAIVAQALFGLTLKAVKNVHLAVLGACALIGVWLGLSEVICLFGCGALAVLARRRSLTVSAVPPLLTSSVGVGAAAASAVPFSLGGLFLVFCKIEEGQGIPAAHVRDLRIVRHLKCPSGARREP